MVLGAPSGSDGWAGFLGPFCTLKTTVFFGPVLLGSFGGDPTPLRFFVAASGSDGWSIRSGGSEELGASKDFALRSQLSRSKSMSVTSAIPRVQQSEFVFCGIIFVWGNNGTGWRWQHRGFLGV